MEADEHPVKTDSSLRASAQKAAQLAFLIFTNRSYVARIADLFCSETMRRPSVTVCIGAGLAGIPLLNGMSPLVAWPGTVNVKLHGLGLP
jgi:hypothetical protein